MPPANPARRLASPTAWRRALLVGFVIQLLLILFVTAIGLQQLGATTRNLNQMVDVHMRKQNFTKAMVISARERTLIMLMLTKTKDLFERDQLLMQFNQKGSEFVTARLAPLDLPLNKREHELIARQRQSIGFAQPLQEQVIELISADRNKEAEDLVIGKAIPAQNTP